MGLYPSAHVFPEDPAGTFTRLTFTARDQDMTAYDVLAGAGNDVWRMISANWGNAIWDTAFAGSRGTLGSLPASRNIQNRTVQLGFRLLSGSLAAAPGHLSDLNEICSLMATHGGLITLRHPSAGYRQHLEVYAGSALLADWTNRAQLSGTYEVACQFTCAPYVRGDSMWVRDRFHMDTESWYTLDVGTGAAVTITGGELKTTTTGTPTIAVHTGIGYSYGDHQAQARARLASITNAGAGVVLKRTGVGTMLAAYAYDNGGTSRVWLQKYEQGTITTLGTSAPFGTRLAIGVPFYVQGRVEGNVVYAEYYPSTNVPTLGGSPTVGVTYTLTGGDIAAFGEAATGQAGVYLYPGTATDAVEEFEVRPYVYKGGLYPGASGFRHQGVDEYRLAGDIPGDAPALCTVDLHSQGSQNTGEATKFAMIGWSPRPATHSMLPDGSFERGIPAGWGVAAVTGVLANAGTSIAQASGGRFGQSCAQIVTPATANSGAVARIERRFRVGVTYTVEGWVRAASATTNVRLRLGVNGDVASTTPAALTSGWVKHTTTWTPTATVEIAYVAAEVTAATGTTFQLDGVMVYEGTTAPTSVGQAGGVGGHPPFGVLEAGAAVAYSSSYRYVDASATPGSVAYYRNGTYLAGTAATTDGWARWVIDPNLIPRDAVRGGLDLEVWLVGDGLEPKSGGTPSFDACLSLPQAWGSATPKAAGAATWTREFSSSGTSNGPNGGAIRLGTLPLDPLDDVEGDAAQPPAPLALTITHGSTPMTTHKIDCVVLVPSQARALGPTVKDTGYPNLSGFIGGAPFTRRFNANLSGYQLSHDQVSWKAMWGLGGSLIELPAGPVDITTLVTVRVPGYQPVSSYYVYLYGAAAFTPTPRWHQLRDE